MVVGVVLQSTHFSPLAHLESCELGGLSFAGVLPLAVINNIGAFKIKLAQIYFHFFLSFFFVVC